MNLLKGIGLILIFLLGVLIQPILWFLSLFVSKDKSLYYHNLRNFTHHKCSCDSHWHNSFSSQIDFEKLDSKLLQLYTPLGHTEWYNPKPKVKFLFYSYGGEDPEGGFIYECKTCTKLWELSDPENAYRGYFKGIDLDKDGVNKYLKK
jgi:hypothetical protein